MSIESDRGRYSFGIMEYPEVNTYTDLPDATLNVGNIYVVKTSSGIWLIARKEAGLWRSNGVIWYRLGDWLASFDDGNFQLYDNAVNTKIAMFQCSGISAATTRTFTFPDSEGTLALISNLASYVPLAGGTMTGTLVLTAGTTTVAPIKLQIGVSLTTPEAGTIEFDGTYLYITI